MLNELSKMSGTRPAIIIWFALDTILALAPPVYWSMSGARPVILGMPLSVFYFVALGFFISASLVTAYLVDDAAGQSGGRASGRASR